MSWHVVVLAVVSLAAGVSMLAMAGDADDETIKKDQKALTGSWRVVYEERGEEAQRRRAGGRRSHL